MSVFSIRSQSPKPTVRYQLVLPADLAETMEGLAKKLKTDQGDVMTRALTLLGYAVDAGQVEVIKEGVRQPVDLALP
jgi:hypothetical protein